MTEQDLKNAAWVEVQIPLPADRLSAFLADIERLFRLNPYLEIADWRKETDPRSYRLSVLNETNGCRSEIALRIEELDDNCGCRLVYASGLKQSTEFSIAATAGGSLLTISEHYHPVRDEQDARLREVDRSLVPWAAAIRSHLRGMKRFGGVPGYRWWAERFMLWMTPRQRRIVAMIVWVSVLEFVVFLFVALIFLLASG